MDLFKIKGSKLIVRPICQFRCKVEDLVKKVEEVYALPEIDRAIVGYEEFKSGD